MFHTTRKLRLSAIFLSCFLMFASLPLGAFPVLAASTHTGALEVRSHQRITIKPGGAITFTIKFKNTGSSTWRNSGANFVAIATTPNLRSSAYVHPFWEAPYRAGRLIETQVAPGQIGTFRFALQAPQQEGMYTEEFQAVARNLAWVDGTEFAIELNVTNEPPKQAVVQEAPTQEEPKTPSLSIDYPIRDTAYKAAWVQGDTVEYTLQAGSQKFAIFEVKNTGTTTWKNTGSRYISLHTVRPNYRDSAFANNGPGWITPAQIRLASDEVKPGEVGKIVAMLQAPSEGGTYTEHFRLAAEDYSWIASGEIALTIIVPQKHQVTFIPKEQQTPPPSTIYKDIEYEASFVSQSEQSITLAPGASVHIQVGYKNTGEKTWNKEGNRFVSLYTIDPNYRTSRFAAAGNNPGWLSSNQISLNQATVRPGEIGYFGFTLTAPSTPGAYREQFRLAAEDWTWIQGGELDLIIQVQGETNSIQEENPLLGPIMRVGLYHSTEPFEITTDSPFEVRTKSGQVLGSLPARTPVTISYNASTNFYTVNSATINRSVAEPILVAALDDQTISEILSLDKPVPWNKAINENVFRGSIEIHHSTATGKTWAINVLPMEHYLRGIAETSSSSPVEFLKVMTVAARTYATYHYERQSKHADEHFYVDSEFDQVYRGYSLEQRHPSLTEAVQGTIGEVITYTDPSTAETKLAITPYFSQSDGRTRDWSEVWGGEVAWCKSVSVPHDVGRPLLGHGVGMSARGGLLMVVEDGLNYAQVLKYFFSGIVIEDRY